MNKIVTTLLVIVLTKFSQGQPQWDVLSEPFLEKGKPLQFANNFTRLLIVRLYGTIYTESFSQLHNISELTIAHSHVEKIEAGAFCSQPVLKSLTLHFIKNHNPPSLNKEVFRNCDNLEEFDLKFDVKTNSSYQINEDILECFPNLSKLLLYGFNTSYLGANLTSKLSRKLKTLRFTNCNIQVIDENAFDGLTNLEDLQIWSNKQLSVIPQNLFKSTPNLKRLSLRDNGIKGLRWNEFEGLTILEELNLERNQIVSFDADKIAKFLPALEYLSIEDNPGPNNEKEAFANQLKNRLKSVQVSIKQKNSY